MQTQEWPLWEVFIRSKSGLHHKHAGSIHAADARMALEHARDVYTRRMEGVSIWVAHNFLATGHTRLHDVIECPEDLNCRL